MTNHTTNHMANNMAQWTKRIIGVLAAIFLAIFVVFTFGKKLFYSGGWGVLLSVSLISLVALLMWFKPRLRLSPLWFGIILAGITILPRVGWIRSSDIPPISDFKIYHDIAVSLLNGKSVADLYLVKFPHVIGYPLILSKVYRVFGSSVLVAQWWGVACTLASVFILWRLVGRVSSDAAGRVAALIFALFPSTIFYSTMVATEPTFTLLFLLCTYLLVCASSLTTSFVTNHATNRALSVVSILAMFGLIGVISAFCNAVRPLAMIFLVAAVIYVLVKNANKKVFLGILGLAIMLMTYNVTASLYRLYITPIIGGTPAKNSFGYTFLVSTNIESRGMWNQADTDCMRDLYNQGHSPDEVNRIMRNKGLERIKSNLGEMPLHYITKTAIMWGSDNDGLEWNLESTKKGGYGHVSGNIGLLKDLSGWYYRIVLVLALIMAISHLFRPDGDQWLFALIVLGYAGAFMLTEVQGRYHYPTLPFLAAMAATAIVHVYGQPRRTAAITSTSRVTEMAETSRQL